MALWFTDITGVVKSVTVPARKVESVIDNGLHFDGSSIEGFARVAESDMVLRPDLSTFTVLPWSSAEERTARLICGVHTPQGDPFIGDPRSVLIKVLREAEELGYVFKTGMELEFFLFKRGNGSLVTPLTPYDDASYFDMADDTSALRRKMISKLLLMGIRVDSAHHEIGSGQYEVDFDYDHALVSADNVLTARVALKTMVKEFGVHCTFMPRPSAELPGSGMHTHQSLHDVDSDDNVFADSSHEYGLSEVARYFLAGQLCHARAMCAVLAPLINSYKRLAVSFEAPKYVTWAHVNRAGAAVIRVPHISPGSEKHTRLEMRCPDPSSNPYLATAVMLAAGLNGIRQKMSLADALEESLVARDRARLRQVEMLPSSLDEAIDALEQDDVMLSALGPYISDRYLAAKRQELDEYKQHVTLWEVERYINRY
ncbi:MAG: glutamine synthetase family protein [Anaerolineae bacterium]